MRKRTDRQAGFWTAKILIAGLIVSVAIGSTGWYVYQTKHKSNSSIITSSYNSGIKGSVFCIIKISESPCQTTLEFQAIGKDKTQQVKTDQAGYFSVRLDPEKYIITPAPKSGYPVMYPLKNPYEVISGQYLDVTIKYGDGRK